MRARAKYNPFAFEDFPHKARVWDRYSQLMWVRKLPAGTHLRVESTALLDYWRGLGWTIERPYQLSVFMNQVEERWLLTISQDRS